METNTNGQNAMQRLGGFASPYKGAYIGSVLLAALGVACGMVPYFAAAGILTALLGGGRDIGFYILCCAAAFLGYLGKTVFANFSTSLSHKTTFRVLADIRGVLAEKLARVPMGYLSDTPSGKLKDILVEKVESLETTLAHLVPEMTANLLIPVVMILYLFILDWRMALASLITLPVGFLCYMGMMKGYQEKWGKYMNARGHMQSTIVEYVNGIEVIKAFGQSAGNYEKYQNAVQDNAGTALRWMKETQGYASAGLAVWPAVLTAVLPIGATLAMSGTLAYPVFITIMILSLGIIGPIISAVMFTDNIAQVGTTLSEIGSVLDQPELVRPAEGKTVSGNDLAVRGIHFSYHEDEILHDVSFTLPAGAVTALVGPSGGGKSTIAKLLAGFWDVSAGQIMLGGTDQREISLHDWNSKVAYVSQDNYLFDTSVMENIRMGRAGTSDGDVIAAAKACGCHDFIMGLQQGYETIAGGAGGHLSGGERQRIAIARAMLKNAPVVILDEATAYTDPENEAVVQKAVAKLVAGKTLLVIAHRLSTVTDADNILVIEKGRLAAEGTHETLLTSSPLYASMWQAHMGAQDEPLVGLDKEVGSC